METQFIPERSAPEGDYSDLSWDRIEGEDSDTTILLWISNNDDSNYHYAHKVTGTKEEIEVIKRLCHEIKKKAIPWQ